MDIGRKLVREISRITCVRMYLRRPRDHYCGCYRWPFDELVRCLYAVLTVPGRKRLAMDETKFELLDAMAQGVEA